jgi:outer membrane protein assembly factor BamD (BamD/ComL family)
VKAPGGRIRGQITAETPAEIKIKPATGADQAVPVDQIASVSYDGAGPSFSLAESRENNNQLAEAAELYKKAATEATAKPFVVQAAKFGRARILTDAALSSPARAKEAVDELEALVQAYPNSRHLGPAMESLIRLHLAKGDTAKAQAALDQFKAKVPNSGDRGTILESRIQAKAGKYDQAIASLDKIIASAKDTPRGREAKLAKAECLVGLNKFDDALATVQEVIKQSPPEDAEIQAVAHNTLGDCYRAAHKPKDALLAYLKTDVLFDKDKEQHPRALAMIEQLFRELGAQIRADEVHERLKQLYPQSPYLAAGAKAGSK